MNSKILVVCLLIVLIFARKNLKQNTKEIKEQKKTVVESNHFYSNYQLTTNYEINNVEKGKSLIYLLKQNQKSEESLKNNPITITLQSGDKKEVCHFNSFTNMCGIKDIEKTDMKLTLQCKKTPCELSWIIYQPPAILNDGKEQIQKFVEIHDKYNHATIIVSCNDPNIKDFSKHIQLYTNSAYKKIVNNEVIYYLFDNEETGYYYITSVNDGAKSCAKVVLKHSNDEAVFNQKEVMQDFILPDKSNQYSFSNIPQHDFRVDSFFHPAHIGKLSKDDGIVVSLIGQKGIEKKVISNVTIHGEEKNTVDFSIVFKNPAEKYDKLLFDFKTIGKEIIIASMNFVSSQRHEVNVGQITYFQLKTSQKINFKLLPQASEVSDTKLTYFFISDQKSFKSSVSECKTKLGCEFNIQAIADAQGSIYFGEKAEKNVSQIVEFNFKNTITKKIRQGQKLLLKTSLKGKKAIQAVVNSPNVIIYTSPKQKCQVISQQCHDKTLNFQNPIIYEPKQDMQLYFMVEGLDLCQFTLTIIQDGLQFIELQDTKPLTYLFDDNQKELSFIFKLKKKQAVNFNLIGPVNQLFLVVFNAEKITDDSEGQTSSDGYLSFSEENINSLSFIVKVQKREEYINKYIHFTLLVSTTEGNVRLQPGVSHFQTIPSQQTRDFVFQFQPQKELLLNFYTHNILNNLDDLNIVAKISTTDDYNNDELINQEVIDIESDVIDIKEVAKKLCKNKAGQNCQLFVRLENKMAVQVDITLTLMVKDSIIQLKDGIWNSYLINEIAIDSHFYFLPKNKNRSITILYKSDFIDLKLMYSLWKTDDKSINPAQWPFPQEYKSQNKNSLSYTPTKFIHIDPLALKDCWPNCVLLISTFKDEKSVKSVYNNFLQYSHFKIMASSNYIEVPEKMKIDIILKKNESKHLLVDLKYVLQKQALTFFTYFTIGSVKLSGNVYQQSNPRCPNGEDESDFKFGNLQTQISVISINNKLKQNDMNEDKNPYLCILAEAYLDSKFSIEYSSDNNIIKQLTLDNFYTHKSAKDTTKIFQLDGAQQFTIKITRTQGFPYMSNKLCKQGDDLENCLDEFKSEKGGKEIQLADKMTSISQQPCEKCIFFLKFTSKQQSEVNIHVQSKYSQTELLQNQMITDQLSPKSENKYSITSIRNQQVIINIQITHGDLEVNVFDYDKLNITKKNEKGAKNILISIPSKDNPNKNSPFGGIFLGFFDYSSFTQMHMTIKSQKDDATSLYTITYSSGEPEIYLQDGLITQYGLMPNRTTKFLYKNPTLSKIYLHLSMADSAVLNKLKVKIYALNNEYDQQSGVQMEPQKPNFNKKTPNPTMIMALPANKFFQIQVTNPQKTYQVLTLGINNRQIIYLPFSHEFPVQLAKGEHIYLVLNVPFQTHVNVQFKKCDQSSLSIGYTTDYDEFIKQEFSYEQQMGEEELMTQLNIKNKKSGSIFIKVQSPDEDSSLLTVKAQYSYSKLKDQKAKPGNKGLVQYSIIDSKKAEINFTPLICPPTNKICNKQFVYSSISSKDISAVYAELICSSVSFDLQDRSILKQAKLSPISASNIHNDKIVFTEQLTKDNQFIGIKAVNNKTGQIVYYKPIEIITVWGQLNKGTRSRGFLIGVSVLVLICAILICYRRKTRSNVSEYAPLSGLQ